ncbi:sugar phosphate isomerase/epimerase [Paenibacillus sp. OV219]|uniref:sugar phosphate isomerase/epimerase family protein n=1 Tax=Paenibacillus sp. OV219 TaxID=1884377 RepID=UPI0008B136F6|nr:sugar phosphate isomerase/epimerase [Paenibacillus sp. OV219]SEO68226.1 Sugar phosphate isomerase/epimerase [Paenibacillus sp. OV219]
MALKLSVFTVAAPDMTPEQLCEAAAASGIDGIEWRCKETAPHLRSEPPSFWGNNHCTLSPSADETEINRFAQAAAKYNRQAISVTPYLTCGDIEGTEQIMRLASKLGATMIRAGVPGYDRSRNYNELFNITTSYLHEVEQLARTYNIKAIIETHHLTIAPSASLAHRLVSSFNPDHIGVLYDPGNMVYEGYENYRMGLELLGPYLAHVHVKNAGWQPPAHPAQLTGDPLQSIEWSAGWRPIANGQVPWKQVLRDLKAVGYDGWLGLEDFSQTFDTPTMLQTYVNQIQTWMEEI